MTVADLSKSLVHIQERYIAPGTIAVTNNFDDSFTFPVVGVRVGDSVIVQPADAAAVTAAGGVRILFSYVSDDDEVTVETTGSVANADVDLVVTVFGRGF